MKVNHSVVSQLKEKLCSSEGPVCNVVYVFALLCALLVFCTHVLFFSTQYMYVQQYIFALALRNPAAIARR